MLFRKSVTNECSPLSSSEPRLDHTSSPQGAYKGAEDGLVLGGEFQSLE